MNIVALEAVREGKYGYCIQRYRVIVSILLHHMLFWGITNRVDFVRSNWNV